MNERLLNNASFSKICSSLQKKESLWQEMKPLLQTALLVIPALVSKELVTILTLHDILDHGLTWLDAGEKFENTFSSIKKLTSKQEDDFITRAENAQIANVLLIFSSYFDTVKIFLPDKENKICLDKVQYYLTEKSLLDYREKLLHKENTPLDVDGKRIADWDLVLPNPLEGLDEYQKNLKKFYLILNNSFRSYLDCLSCVESSNEKFHGELNEKLNKIPDTAIKNYRAQYFSLAAICPDFFVWTNQQEHQHHKELVDRGFKTLYQQIQSIPKAINNYHATEALQTLQNWYSNRIKEPIIPLKDMPPQDQGMKMPNREDSFIPQAYEWLIYRERISLEATQHWKDGGEIGPDILNLLRSPELGSKPILILGDPGAGKTMLCHILAGKILCHEYHVIVLHLRDLNVDQSITEQINQEIAQTTDDTDCKWGNILKAKPQKPILLIFDGYDEILQATGKEYRNYLEKILDFQEKQWESHGIIVKSIVTSRIVLIDKVEVPLNSTVIKLKAFDKSRIDTWCEIWNNSNETYFASRNLKPLEIEEKSKAWELAGEPLLLLMLALFDTKDNALRKHQNLQATELYASLIWDFVDREKRKDATFSENQISKQNRIIEKEIERISIAALGMYNRYSLHITSGQLENDLKLLSTINSNSELQDSEKLLGSFFFIHDMATRSSDKEEKEKLRAYTFLHNTFGEFLAAYYIVLQLYNLLDDLTHHINKYDDKTFSFKDKIGWYACMSYAPLFRRPVVGQMIREWVPQFFRAKNMDIKEVNFAIQELINREIPRILHGDVIFELKIISRNFQNNEQKFDCDLMKHISIYSNNLLSVAALLTDSVNLSKFESQISRSWDKFLHLWRYTFDENEIAAFAGQFEIAILNDESVLIASDYTMELEGENDRITKLYNTYNNLNEEPHKSILGTLLGSNHKYIYPFLLQQDLHLESQSILLGIILKRSNKKEIHKRFTSEETRILKEYCHICLHESNYEALYTYFLVLNDIATNSISNLKYVISLLDWIVLTEVYAHCNRHHPIIALQILELLLKLLPAIHPQDLYRILERFSHDFEFGIQLSDQSTRLWANILLNCSQRNVPRIYLDTCWRLLRDATRRVCKKYDVYTPETLKNLLLLNLQSHKSDHTFPLDFTVELIRRLEKYLHRKKNIISFLPLLELLDKFELKEFDNLLCNLSSHVLNVCTTDVSLALESIGQLATLLIKDDVQKDIDSWLYSCHQLLQNAENYIHQDTIYYSEEIFQKLFLIYNKAHKINPHFPPVFVLKYANWKIEFIRNNYNYYSKPKTIFLLCDVCSDLAFLTTVYDILPIFGHTKPDMKKIVSSSIETILEVMFHHKITLFDLWLQNQNVILALCHNIDEYSPVAQNYLLSELKELIKKTKMKLSLEMYLEIKKISSKYKHIGLQSAIRFF